MLLIYLQEYLSLNWYFSVNEIIGFAVCVCVCVSVCVYMCVCVCVFSSIHREGFICLDQLEYQGTDQRYVEDVNFLC